MDFTLTEEQNELRGLARQILSDRMDLGLLRALDDSTDWFDRDTWAELAKANLLGVALPESVGGLGFDFLEQCLILQEQGRAVAPLPLLHTQALKTMRAEIENLAEAAKQSIGLLRRHL